MIRHKEVFWVICDKCGRDVNLVKNGSMCYQDSYYGAEDTVELSGGMIINGSHLCALCARKIRSKTNDKVQ